MFKEEIKIPDFALEDYYLNKKTDEINEKAELFKMAERLSEENDE